MQLECKMKYMLCVLVAMVTFFGNAEEPKEHELRSLWGVLDEVVSPTQVIVNINGNGDKVRVDLRGIKTPYAQPLADCLSEESRYLCEFMERTLSGKVLGIVPEVIKDDWLSGDLVYNNKSITVTSLENGYYKVNAENTRSLRYLIAEKEARCKHKGIWYQYKGDPLIAKQCQS